MVKSRILRATAVAATSFGLVAGLTGIAGASAGTISSTGTDSSNKIVTVNEANLDLNNHNHLFLMSQNAQSSNTGDAGVFHNTTGGNATTGKASNSTALAASVSISNSAPSLMGGSSTLAGGGSIDHTGTDSTNKVVTINKANLDINNNNSVMLTTTNEQMASSGDAKVAGNTTGGSATTGDASNSSTSTFTISIQN